MRGWILVGVYILLYQLIDGKSLNRKTITESTELIREKREEVEEDERSSEMQKFMLDLSSKEDMSRLRERFKSGTSEDIENDAEYRRLKRFSIHDDDEEKKMARTSGTKAMSMRSSTSSQGTGEESKDISEHNTETPEDSTQASDGSMETPQDSLEHNEDMSENSDDTTSVENSSERSGGNEETPEYKSKRPEDKTTAYNLGDEHDLNLGLTRRNAADGEIAGSRVHSHHIVGGSWELIHHYPMGSLSSLANVNTAVTGNTTMHSEYLQDNEGQYDSDDVTQYERAGKSRRKPRVSRPRPTRSVEPEYEVREISEVKNPDHPVPPESSRDDQEDMVTLNTRAIKRDGYIGCFIDQHPNRDLKKMFSVNNLTPHSCRAVCKEKGHVYAGVQYGYLCHCGDEYGKYGEAGDHECNSACLGDEGRKCGGFWRNSVYASAGDEDEKQNENTNQRETRSHIDRVIPLSPSEGEETPVRQEITVYLRTEIPKRDEKPKPNKDKNTKDAKPSGTTRGPAANSKRTEIPTLKSERGKQAGGTGKMANYRDNRPSKVDKAVKRTGVNGKAYLHPQISQKEFIPSSVVLKTLTSSTKKRIYTGFIKLKQNWDDSLQNKRSPKTLILAGNIESAFGEMFAKDPHFEKATVLTLREATIQHKPDTVHKVLVEFALVFKKEAKKKDKKLREFVESNSRLADMPVFADSLDVKEYDGDDSEEGAGKKEKRQDGVDAFLQEVFRQI